MAGVTKLLRRLGFVYSINLKSWQND
ncbi:hypothetical protein [Candidatus Tisiphia endosymbiont of Dioctria rufipes]